MLALSVRPVHEVSRTNCTLPQIQSTLCVCRDRRPAARARTNELTSAPSARAPHDWRHLPRQPRAHQRRPRRPSGLLRGCPMADDVILCASELAANAAIHSRSRLPGGTFTVRAKISPGDYAWIEVEDNGGPWTPAVRDRPSTTDSTSSAPWPANAASTATRTAAPSGPDSTGPSDGCQAHRPRGPMDGHYRWSAVAGTPPSAGALAGGAGPAGGSQRAHGVQS